MPTPSDMAGPSPPHRPARSAAAHCGNRRAIASRYQTELPCVARSLPHRMRHVLQSPRKILPTKLSHRLPPKPNNHLCPTPLADIQIRHPNPAPLRVHNNLVLPAPKPPLAPHTNRTRHGTKIPTVGTEIGTTNGTKNNIRANMSAKFPCQYPCQSPQRQHPTSHVHKIKNRAGGLGARDCRPVLPPAPGRGRLRVGAPHRAGQGPMGAPSRWQRGCTPNDINGLWYGARRYVQRNAGLEAPQWRSMPRATCAD
jgi:hypothetical protein